MFVLMYDDGEALGPFDSAEEAIRAAIHALATDPDVLPEYATRARTLDSVANWSVFEDDWFKATKLVEEVDLIVFSVNMVVGQIENLFPELKPFEKRYIFGSHQVSPPVEEDFGPELGDHGFILKR